LALFEALSSPSPDVSPYDQLNKNGKEKKENTKKIPGQRGKQQGQKV